MRSTHDELVKALDDQSPYVRIVAAEALGRYGTDADLEHALPVLLELAPVNRNGVYVSMFALNALDSLGARRPACGRPSRRCRARTPP